MLPVSALFLSALRGSHAIVSRARVITPGATGADPPGTDLAVIEGSVTLDGTADVRGSLDLVVAGNWPYATTVADLVPYGTELAVSRGLVYGNGNIERAPLGIFRVVAVEQDNVLGGMLRITAQDRMSGIVEARLEGPVQYPVGTINTYGEILSDLVLAVYPAAVIEWDDIAVRDSSAGRQAVAEEDRFGYLNEMVQALGKIWYWDYRGVLVVKTPPPPTVPVWEVGPGANGVLVSAARTRTREGVYNAVVATGEALDDKPPVRAVVRDLDTTSITWYEGPFGKVPRFYSSSFITTVDQAAQAAAALLTQSTGLPYSVEFGAVPNPALEPFDVVRLTYPTVPGAGTVVGWEDHVLESITIPLAPGEPMPCRTRLTVVG